MILAIAERQDRLSALEARLRTGETARDAIELEIRRMEGEVRNRLHDPRGMLGRKPEEVRKVIQTVVAGSLRFTPVELDEGKRYQMEGEASVVNMLTGDGPVSCTNVASPAGYARRCTRQIA